MTAAPLDEYDFSLIIARERLELTGYLRRLVVRPSISEELMQETALRAWIHREQLPPASEMRPFLFRIATNLAIDYLRKQSTFRETVLLEAQTAAERNPEFLKLTVSLRGRPEVAAIAREHLTACFACTLRQLPPEQAATLLLREIYQFTNEEVARILGARFAQVKNWLSLARTAMNSRYAKSCALINKQGVCYQCVELAEMFGSDSQNPLDGTTNHLEDRYAIVRKMRDAHPGTWENLLVNLLDEIGT